MQSYLCRGIFNGRSVAVLGGFQVFFHPALVANEHGVVNIAVNVGNGGTASSLLLVVWLIGTNPVRDLFVNGSL
jgi:hypothetical protein